MTATSANGLSVTTQSDSTGNGVFDTATSDVTVVNADGIGTAHNYLSNGGNDIFLCMSTGQIALEEFNGSGARISSLLYTGLRLGSRYRNYDHRDQPQFVLQRQ